MTCHHWALVVSPLSLAVLRFGSMTCHHWAWLCWGAGLWRFTTEPGCVEVRVYDVSPLSSSRVTTEPGCVEVRVYEVSPLSSSRVTTEPGCVEVRVYDVSPLSSSRVTTEPGCVEVRVYEVSPLSSSRVTTEPGCVEVRVYDATEGGCVRCVRQCDVSRLVAKATTAPPGGGGGHDPSAPSWLSGWCQRICAESKHMTFPGLRVWNYSSAYTLISLVNLVICLKA